MEDVEKQVVDTMFTILNKFIDEAPVELHFNQETTYLFIPFWLISLSGIGSFKGYIVTPSPYSNKIILSDLKNCYIIEQNI